MKQVINIHKFIALIVLITSSLAVKAGDIEILSGEDMVVVDSDGNYTGKPPETIAPEGFNPIMQQRATLPANQVSQRYRAMRDKKGGSPLFNFNQTFSTNTELPDFITDCLRRPQVMLTIKNLSAKGNTRVSIAKKRLHYYQPTFERIFAEEGIPLELISIGFVESTYNPSAISPAGARGIWQFIPKTGKVFGLESEDDFQDPVKSTKAAAKYLKRLHNRFGDWLLAIAAYNAGETRVHQAINLSNGNRDFWEVSRFLPTETRNYVPRVVAAATLMNGNNQEE